MKKSRKRSRGRGTRCPKTRFISRLSLLSLSLSSFLSAVKLTCLRCLGLDPTEIRDGKPRTDRSSANRRSYPLVMCIFVQIRVHALVCIREREKKKKKPRDCHSETTGQSLCRFSTRSYYLYICRFTLLQKRD
ncbi:hypothetical protein PUN28_017385 [Cardiocondyla obscurior]|uniref:Secreted protein n=1 Tax=Cardiocondyla obscurior TaxID=286306 RepID=A0AAW2EN74_9HYME